MAKWTDNGNMDKRTAAQHNGQEWWWTTVNFHFG
jgi:hypothetical protein